MKLKHGGKETENLQDKTLRKFVNQAADVLEPLLDVIHADNMSHAPEYRMDKQIEKVRDRLQTWDLDAIIKAKLPVNGNDIVALGAKGQLVGKIMTRLKDRWLEKGSLSRDMAITIAQDMIKANASI